MSIKKNKNQLIISVLVGLAIFIITYLFIVEQYEKSTKQEELIKKLTASAEAYALNPESTTFYVVAKRDLPKDYVITADDIEMKYLEMKINGACTDSKLAIGAKTFQETKKGRPVILKNITAKKDSSNNSEPKIGFRAVAATIAANKIPPFVKDNVYLDVYTAEGTFQAQNVRVLKVEDTANKSNKLILFEIKEEDVGAFINGMSTDKLIPVQKNSNDENEYSFSYDPFKYASYTVTNEELEQANEPPAAAPIYTTTPAVNTAPSKKNIETVEIIQGSVVKTVDF